MREFFSIDEYNALDGPGEVNSLLREGPRCYEHTFVRALTGKSTIESLHFRSAYHTLPPFCLDVHFFRAKPVQRDYTVDAPVADSIYPLQIFSTRSGPDAMEQVEHDSRKNVAGSLVIKSLEFCGNALA